MSITRTQIRTELHDLFKKNISLIMALANVKKVDLARDLGVSKQTITNWTNADHLDSISFLCMYHGLKHVCLEKISNNGSRKSVKEIYIPLIQQYIQEIGDEMKKGLF